MVYKFFPNLKNREKGVTLVEIVVVMFIIAVFSLVVISDFPKITRQAALSRAAYKLAQDLRRVEDLALSGVGLYDVNNLAIAVKGYGARMLTGIAYLVYADVSSNLEDPFSTGNHIYDETNIRCSEVSQRQVRLKEDCVLGVITITDENPSLFINAISGYKLDGSSVSSITNSLSINFRPPNPTVEITDSQGVLYSEVKIDLSNTDNAHRFVLINKAGLIEVQ